MTEFLPCSTYKFPENFPGAPKISRELSGNEIYGNFPGFPGRDFPGISPSIGLIAAGLFQQATNGK